MCILQIFVFVAVVVESIPLRPGRQNSSDAPKPPFFCIPVDN